MINFLGQAKVTLLHQSLSWLIYDSERQGPQSFTTPCQSCFVSTYKGQCSTLWKLSACICFNSILRSMFRLRYCFDLPGIIQSNQNLKKGKWQRKGFNRFWSHSMPQLSLNLNNLGVNADQTGKRIQTNLVSRSCFQVQKCIQHIQHPRVPWFPRLWNSRGIHLSN